MPWEETEKEIRHRVRDPGDFQQDSFRRVTIKRDRPQVFAIVGRLKGESKTTIQALRFPKDQGWTVEKAKTWVKEHFKTSAEISWSEIFDGLPDHAEFLAGQPITSIDDEKRTVNIVFFTGIDIPRMNFWTGQKFILRFDPKGADLSLLNNGAPVLDNHNAWGGIVSQKGVVEQAWAENSKWMATLRFSKRASVDELWEDIKDKIITKFSMGVEILESMKEMDGQTEILTAKKWRPFELSITPIPADFGTTTLAALEGGPSERANAQKETDMSEQKDAGIEARVDDKGAAMTAQEIYNQQIESARQAGIIQELARVTQILEIGRVLHLPIEMCNKAIRDKTTVEKFREMGIAYEAEQAGKFPPNSPRGITLVRDEIETRRGLMTAALFGMMNPREHKEDKDNPFIGLTMKQIAEESVRLQHNLHRMPPMTRVVELAMQTTADFANVLEATARKQLLAAYAYANPTYRLWTKPSTSPDFKTMTRVRLGETPEFLKVPEGGQITIGLMTDSKESYALATYGRGISFSRQMLINDDLGAFNDLISQFGIQAARLENKTVYSILNTNAAMADTIALFFATHYNLGSGAIGNTALDAMFTAMGIQKGIDGKTMLNLIPRFLIVPKAKEATARATLMTIGPNVKAADQNWFAGRLEPVADAELDGTSTAVWYGAADPAFAPGIEYCHLEGATGPQFIQKENESGILGMQFYAFLDFAAKAVDWRPLYKSTGV